MSRANRRRLNEKQIVAIELMSVPGRGGMTYAEIAEKAGVTERQLYNWRQDDDFMDEVMRRTVRNSVEYLPDILASVPRHIIVEGNAAMLRTYLQSIGALTEKVEVSSKDGGSGDVDKIREELERIRKPSGNDE